MTNVATLCQQESMDHVDAIVCGLPWASFSDALQREIMEAMLDVLQPSGQFATFAYWQGLLLPAGRRFAGFADRFSDDVFPCQRLTTPGSMSNRSNARPTL